jgi:GAF domain-containing protein
MTPDLGRLIIRHRHVAPMLSALLGGTQAAVRITDATGTVILERDTTRLAAQPDRFPIVVEGRTLGWVDGDRIARAVASVLSYAAAREMDKRSLAQEALDRYRELNLVYDLAERLSGELDTAAIAEAAEEEAGRLVKGGRGILRTGDAGGILGAVGASGVAEIVGDVAADPRASREERSFASLAAAPVTAHGEHLGALAVATDDAREIRAAELKLLTAIAAIVGPVLGRVLGREAGSGVGAREAVAADR